MRKKHFIRGLAWFTVIMGMIVLAMIIWYRASVNIDQPVPASEETYDFDRQIINNKIYISDHGWLKHTTSGTWELYVEGDPFTRGYTYGLLAQELIENQETAFIDGIRKMIPSEFYLKTLRYFIAIFNRKLPDYVPMEYQEEISGISHYFSEEFDFIGPPYLRILNYHAAHDIGHALQNMNLVACTSFGVWDDASADSSMIIGRNFDFYVGDEFSKEKIIMFVKPDEGHAFMSIGWGGFIGVVSGMNDKGLTVTLNAAKSSIPFSARTPVSILARDILQYASNIDEALDIAKKYHTFVSESFLIGSAQDRRSALIEKTPDETILFETGTNYIVVTNHFQAEAFTDDELNLENMENGTSVYRFNRTKQLLDNRVPLDVEGAAKILRDYKGLNDQDIGLGNEKAVNQFIAHHSVIFKPEELKVWVSTPPYQLGEYIGYDLQQVFADGLRWHLNPQKIENIPADAFLQNPVYHKLIKYKVLSEKITEGQDGISGADSLIIYNPEFFMTYRILGDYYHELGQSEKANQYYRIALEKEAPSYALLEYVREKLEE